jgi:hypothetical protein
MVHNYYWPHLTKHTQTSHKIRKTLLLIGSTKDWRAWKSLSGRHFIIRHNFWALLHHYDGNSRIGHQDDVWQILNDISVTERYDASSHFVRATTTFKRWSRQDMMQKHLAMEKFWGKNMEWNATYSCSRIKSLERSKVKEGTFIVSGLNYLFQ